MQDFAPSLGPLDAFLRALPPSAPLGYAAVQDEKGALYSVLMDLTEDSFLAALRRVSHHHSLIPLPPHTLLANLTHLTLMKYTGIWSLPRTFPHLGPSEPLYEMSTTWSITGSDPQLQLVTTNYHIFFGQLAG